jgi:hypothetical protein
MRMSVGKKDRIRLKLTSWKTDNKAAAKTSSKDIQRRIEREPLNTLCLLPSHAWHRWRLGIYPKIREVPLFYIQKPTVFEYKKVVF